MRRILDRPVDEAILAKITTRKPSSREAAEIMWTGFYNQVLEEILAFFPGTSLDLNSNVADLSATSDNQKPDCLLRASGRLLFAREDKRESTMTELDAAIKDLVSKHSSFQVHLFGEVEEIFCMATAGNLVQFFLRNLAAPGSITALSDVLSVVENQSAVFSKLFNIVAWANIASRYLPNSFVLRVQGAEGALQQTNVFFTDQQSTLRLHTRKGTAYAYKIICVPKDQYDFLSKHVYVTESGDPSPFDYSSSTHLESKVVDKKQGRVTMNLKITPVG